MIREDIALAFGYGLFVSILTVGLFFWAWAQ